MQAYNKLIASAVGAVMTGLVAFGVIGEEESRQLTETVTLTVTSLAVYFIPNKGA